MCLPIATERLLRMAAITGIPFVGADNLILSDLMEPAQDFHSARLIQPAPTLPNDSRGLACGLGYGVAADTQKNCND